MSEMTDTWRSGVTEFSAEMTNFVQQARHGWLEQNDVRGTRMLAGGVGRAHG